MPQSNKQAKVSYAYDRLWEQKLAQAYHLLVPADSTVVSEERSFYELTPQTSGYEDSRHLHPRVLGAAERK